MYVNVLNESSYSYKKDTIIIQHFTGLKRRCAQGHTTGTYQRWNLDTDAELRSSHINYNVI